MDELRRNSRGIEESLTRVAPTTTTRYRDQSIQELGVLIRGGSTNLFREYVEIDRVFQMQGRETSSR